MLFSNSHAGNRRSYRNGHANQQPQPQSQPVVPTVLVQGINDTCTCHGLPIRKTLAKTTLSHRGEPVAEYKCPACGFVNGWALDRNTGRPFILYSRQR